MRRGVRGSCLVGAPHPARTAPGRSGSRGRPRTISSSNHPASMDATALRCDRNAHWSASSLVTSPSRAEFSPTVIDMSQFGASAVGGMGRRDPSLFVAVVQVGPAEGGHRRDALGSPATTTSHIPDRDGGHRHLDGREPGGAVAVDGETGYRGESQSHRGVSGDVASALEHLAEDDVVDVRACDSGPFDGGLHRDLGQREGVDSEPRFLGGLGRSEFEPSLRSLRQPSATPLRE